jgi:integrase/recombinase XerC
MAKITKLQLPGRNANVRLLEAFKSGKSEKTLKSYLSDLEEFRSYIGKKSVDECIRWFLSLDSPTANLTVKEYQTHMVEKEKKAPSTVNRRLAAIKSVVKLGSMLGLITWRLEIRALPVMAYKDTHGPGSEVIQTLLDKLKKEGTIKAIRDIAIIRLFHDNGLRRSELSNLDLDDLIESENKVWIKGKGRLEKESVYLAEGTMDAIQDWLSIRGVHSGPLFTSLDPAAGKNEGEQRSLSDHRRFSAHGIWKMITKHGRSIGHKIRPHGIRHTAVTNAVEAADKLDITLDEVKDFSRHKSIETLMLYRDRNRNVQGKLSEAISKKVK